MRYEHKRKFPQPHKRGYKCPVVIWNKKGNPLWFEVKQQNIM